MLRWLKRLQTQRRENARQRGYDWAAGLLLRGGSALEVQTRVDVARSFGAYDAFNMGAEQALLDFERLKTHVQARTV